MNYIYAPCENEKMRNDLLDFLFEEIGRLYGRNSNEKLRKKGIQYIVSKVPHGKISHVKNMIKVFKNRCSFGEQSVSKYFYKMHKEKYGKYAQELMKCIKNDDYLLSIVKNNCENGLNICSEIIYGDEIMALNLLIKNCLKNTSYRSNKNKKYAINIKNDIKVEDFSL